MRLKCPPSANTPHWRIGKSAVGTALCYNLTSSHNIGQRGRQEETRGRNGGWKRATWTQGDESRGERWSTCGGQEVVMASKAADERCIVGKRQWWPQTRVNDSLSCSWTPPSKVHCRYFDWQVPFLMSLLLSLNTRADVRDGWTIDSHSRHWQWRYSWDKFT